jgi:hypothetical protein
VRQAADAIRNIDRIELRRRYGGIHPPRYAFEKCDGDFEYVWSWFPHLQRLFQQAAEAGRWVVFLAGL